MLPSAATATPLAAALPSAPGPNPTSIAAFASNGASGRPAAVSLRTAREDVGSSTVKGARRPTATTPPSGVTARSLNENFSSGVLTWISCARPLVPNVGSGVPSGVSRSTNQWPLKEPSTYAPPPGSPTTFETVDEDRGGGTSGRR